MKEISAYDAQHIQAIFKEREAIFRLSFPVPFVLVMTDEAGTVLFSMMHPEASAFGSALTYPVGSSMLSRKMNAVSQATARGKDVYVRGDEPWLQNGLGWSCFALQMWNDSKDDDEPDEHQIRRQIEDIPDFADWHLNPGAGLLLRFPGYVYNEG